MIFLWFTMIFHKFSQIKKRQRQNLRSKNFILKHIILYVQCVDLLMWSPIKLNFSFYGFSIITMIFQKVNWNFLKKEKDKTMVTVATSVTVASSLQNHSREEKWHGLKSWGRWSARFCSCEAKIKLSWYLEEVT